jgi:hypothetical protein
MRVRRQIEQAAGSVSVAEGSILRSCKELTDTRICVEPNCKLKVAVLCHPGAH